MDRASIAASLLPTLPGPPVGWRVSAEPVDYLAALAAMDRRVDAIAAGRAPECVWLLEHPPVYTAGTSAQDRDLSGPRFPVHRSGRGGQYTYHGPGQRVAYVMLDLKRRRPDVRAFVAALEDWLIESLAGFGIVGERREDRVGVWVKRPDGTGEDKIAALGIRIRRWISFHGVSVNVAPDLSHYSGIVPCGISGARFGVTSLAALGVPVDMATFDLALRACFEGLFGATAAEDATAVDGERLVEKFSAAEPHEPGTRPVTSPASIVTLPSISRSSSMDRT